MRGVLALVAAVIMFGQTESKGIKPEDLREDLAILRSAIDEAHPGAYRYSSRAEVDAAFAEAAANVTRPMTSLEFYRVVAPAIAVVKCGHTGVRIKEAQESLLLPAEVRIVGRQVYVFHDYSSAGTLTWAEIRAINGVGVSDILTTMLASVHGDGDSHTAGPWRLSHRLGFARQLHLLLGIESPFQLKVRQAGRDEEVRVDGLPLAKIKLPAREDRFATYRVLDGGHTAVLKAYAFAGKADVLRDAFSDMAERHVSSLIIDVRDNSGGADELGKLLFSYLVDQPFPYYRDLVVNKLHFDMIRYTDSKDDLFDDVKASLLLGKDKKYHFTGHPNWGTQQPSAPHFGGAVYVLMNGGSFSTTGEFLSTLRHHQRATFVGEESAAGYYGNTSGDMVSLILPHSKLEAAIPLLGYYMAIEGNDHGSSGIVPDVKVQYSMEDYLAGTDKEMNAALELISRAKSK